MKTASLLVLLVLTVACSGGGVADTGGGEPADTTSPSSTTLPPTTTTMPPPTTTTMPPLSIVGTVVGPDDKPIAGALVAVHDVSTTTGSDGVFDLEVEAPGTLVVTKPGWEEASLDWKADTQSARVPMERLVVRGLRVGAAAAGDEAHFNRLLDLAATTSVNAFVFDTKQEGGKVLYDTSVQAAHEAGAVEVNYDPIERLAQVEAAGLYAITRIAVFEDSYRVAFRPDEKLAGIWVDPRSRSAWDYNIELAVEACELGFHEIQFDYVRFPAGRTAQVSGQMGLAQEERVAAIEGFLSMARESLTRLGCALSADIFGIVVSMPDDQGLGQRPEELSYHVDALSPMVYPSHYSPGWLGFSDPNDHPYDVTADAIDSALARMEGGAALRPWLQAFWWSDDQIRSSIQAAEDRGVGWILWNVSSRFDVAAIPSDADLERR